MARKAKEDAAQAVATEDPPKPKPSKAALCWYGMLPATSPIPFPIPTAEVDDTTGEYYKLVEYHPLDLWTGRAGKFKGERIFTPRLRAYNACGAGGLAFNAFSEHVLEYGGQTVRHPFPGECRVMSDSQIRQAVEGIRAHFVRFKLGVEEQNAVTHHQNVEIWDTRLGAKPAEFTDAQWERYRVDRAIDKCPEMTEDTDLPLADYLYLVKLDADWNSWPKSEFLRDPHGYYKRVVPSMEEFFQKPPLSISEMYPQA